MRYFVLTLILASTTSAQAFGPALPMTPPSTFPEEGTFCAPLTLCPKTAIKEDNQ